MEKLKAIIYQNKLSLIFMVLIALIMVVFTYQLIQIQSQIGVAYWDIFHYLNNALRMAGRGVGDALQLSPFLPFLTSFLFRAGFVSELALFLVSGILYILGTLGMYLLLKLRFNEWESLAGALSYATFTIVVAWAVSGALDVPATSFSIWAIYFTVLATKKDAKFYYLAFPLAMIAFLTRYTSGLLLIPFLVLIYFKSPSKEELKKAIKGIILGIIVYIPFMFYFWRQRVGLLPFISQFSASAAGSATKLNPGYNLDLLYYLKHILSYISSPAQSQSYQQTLWPSLNPPNLLSYLILGIIIIGIMIYLIRTGYKLKKVQIPHRYLKVLLIIILALVFFISFGRISYIYSEAMMIMLILALYITLKPYSLEYLDLDLMFLAWFAAFLIMHSFHPVKVDRYFITMAPPLAYGVALGIQQISTPKFKFKKWASPLISLILVGLLIFSTINYLDKMPREDPLVINEKEVAEWLVNYDPGYQERTIAALRGPAYSWYLKKFVYTRIPGKIDPEVFMRLFKEADPDYYIYSNGGKLELEGYTPIKQLGNVTIFRKNQF